VALCENVYIQIQGLIMSESTTISIRLEAAVKARLDHLAHATHRSKSFLAAEAIRTFVELNEWQIREIQTALQEADAGDFAKPSEVNKVLGKWRKPA
jgi:predicted transcriptional regulator